MKEVIEYFKNKAKDYDLVEGQTYWILSDKLLWENFKETVLNKLPRNFKFLDAGGGTGRWTIKILEEYPNATGIIVDISKEMLNEARKKIEHKQLDKRIKIIENNLEDLDNIKAEQFNLSFNFHNVLGFVENPKKVIHELKRVTKKDGYIVSLVPNLYHNIFFNIFVNDMELASETIKTNKGRFTQNMPSMNMFTPNSIRDIYNEEGISTELISGFPITIYPGMQETQIDGNSEHVQDILTDEKMFNEIYEIERKLFKNSDIAARGNQIYIIGRKL